MSRTKVRRLEVGGIGGRGFRRLDGEDFGDPTVGEGLGGGVVFIGGMVGGEGFGVLTGGGGVDGVHLVAEGGHGFAHVVAFGEGAAYGEGGLMDHPSGVLCHFYGIASEGDERRGGSAEAVHLASEGFFRGLNQVVNSQSLDDLATGRVNAEGDGGCRDGGKSGGEVLEAVAPRADFGEKFHDCGAVRLHGTGDGGRGVHILMRGEALWDFGYWILDVGFMLRGR